MKLVANAQRPSRNRSRCRRWESGVVLAFGLLTCLAGAQASEQAAREAADESWQQVAATLDASVLVDLRRDEVVGQLKAIEPDWFLVQELDAGLSAAAGRLEDPAFLAFRYAWNQWLQQLPPPPVARLAAAAREASTHPMPWAPDAVESLRQRFRKDLLEFENRLLRLTDEQGWSEYLEVAGLKAAVSDLATLRTRWDSVDALPARWRLGAAIWRLAEFQQAAQALDRLASQARIFADADFVSRRRSNLARLAALLTELPPDPDAKPSGEVADICRWLRLRAADLSLVAAVERRFVRPNLLLRLPAAALSEHWSRDLDESFPVNDVIAGTRVRGQGRLSGRLSTRFLPRIGQGALELSLEGQTQASTLGSNRGATVSSTGTTRLRGTKLVLIDVGGIHPLPASADADTDISYNAVNTSNSRYGRQVRSRVYGSRGQAERESAWKASQYAASKLDEALDPRAATFNRELQQRILLPLASRQALPEIRGFRSGASGLTIELLQRLPGQFGASQPPPPATDPAATQLLVHESFPSQLAARLVQNQTIAGDDLLRGWSTAEPSDGEQVAAQPWSLTFDASDPVAVEFRDGLVHVTLRLAGFHSDERDYAGMEISLQYRLRIQGGRVIMVRDGDLRIYPLGFVSGQQRLSGPQLVTRQVLKTRLETGIPDEIDLGDWLGAGEAASAQFTGFATRDGWLSLDLTAATHGPLP